MDIKTLLISQPAPQGDKSPYFDLAEKHELKVDFRQFIAVEGILLSEYRTQKVNILEHTAVLITSKTAIDNYFRLADEMRIAIPASMKFFCLTESLAYYLQKYITFRKRKIFYGEGNIDMLMPLIKKHKNEKFLVPVAKVHKPTIPNKLKKNKIHFTKAVMFKTVSADLSDLKDVKYDILAFFSPAGISSLLDNFPKFTQNGTKIACFGQSTAKAIKAAGFRIDIKAPSKETPSMSMAIDRFLAENNK